MKYTKNLIKCPKCSKTNYFLVEVVKKKKTTYWLTKCPKCKKYEEVKKLSAKEVKDMLK